MASFPSRLCLQGPCGEGTEGPRAPLPSWKTEPLTRAKRGAVVFWAAPGSLAVIQESKSLSVQSGQKTGLNLTWLLPPTASGDIGDICELGLGLMALRTQFPREAGKQG